MKKLAILFLLTAVFASFAFAQVSLKADFAIKNVNKGNTAIDAVGAGLPNPGTIGQIGYADPTLTLIFAGSGSQDIGPGKLGFEGAVGIANSFADTDYGMQQNATAASGLPNTSFQSGLGLNAGGVSPTDDTYAGATYGFGAGPGTLGFGVMYKFNGVTNYMWTLEPSVQYTGINAGPIVFGVGLLYDYKFNGISTDNATGTEKGAPFFHPYGESKSIDQIKFWFDIDTAFGLYIKYQFSYGWGKDATGRASFYRALAAKGGNPSVSELQGQREITNIAYLNIRYSLGGLAKVGLEVDDTGAGFRGAYLGFGASDASTFNTETQGFTLKPYVDFAVNNLGFGAYLTFTHVMPTNVDAEIQVKPGVWVKYTL